MLLFVLESEVSREKIQRKFYKECYNSVYIHNQYVKAYDIFKTNSERLCPITLT